MRVRVVLGVVGHLLRLFALAFLPPLLMAVRDGLFSLDWEIRTSETDLQEAARFLLTACTTFLIGTFLARKPREGLVFRRSEAIAVVVATWCAVSAVASLPFLLAGMPPVDALFEGVSGLSTTGATVLLEWDRSRAFFLWRAMTQWIGGLGVIAMFVVVLPRLGIAGRQIFFAEASTAPSEAVSPTVRSSARRLWALYIGLTLAMTLLLLPAGVGFFDALVHAFAAVSSGGFSNHPESVMGYRNPLMEWIMVPFLLLAGASFPLMLRALTREPLAPLRDGELRLYLGIATVATLGLAVIVSGGVPDERALRESAFNVSSLISCAGFANADYDKWGAPAKAILLLVTIAGGCAGSTGGGAKQVRFLLVLKFLRREITRVLHPRAVLPVRHGGEAVSRRVLYAVCTLVLLYLATYALVALLVVLCEGGRAGWGDLDVGMSVAVACVNNAGPGFGPAGPMGSFSGFTDASKLVLSAAMMIGRLEIVTVLALFHPHVWRHITWARGRGARV